MICFYHSGDLDGHCSGAIVRHRFPDCRMVGIDYEDEFPWHEVDAREHTYMVDFSLPPELMDQLFKQTAGNFWWIDHHQTAIKKMKKALFSPFNGAQSVGKAACELTWEFFFPDAPIPHAVRLLGRYDVWDETQPNWHSEIVPFQYGMRGYLTDPGNPDSKQWWDILAAPGTSKEWLDNICNLGQGIITYQRSQDAKLMARHSFYTRLDDIAAQVVNHGPGGSMKFEQPDPGSMPDHEMFPLCISFARLPQEKWLVNLYTFQEDVDCGEIACKHGGGGHRKAAGFICKELPFKI